MNLWKIALGFLLLLILLFSIQKGWGPSVRYQAWNQFVESDSVFLRQYKSIQDAPELSELLRNRAFLQAQLQLAEDDSIGMVIDLTEKTCKLVIKGVTIHSAEISKIKLDPLLKKVSNRNYYRIFSEPLLPTAYHTSIVKEPIVVKHAPKTPEEAEQNAYLPDTLAQDPAFLAYELPLNIQLRMEQDVSTGKGSGKARRKFRSSLRHQEWSRSLGNAIRFKKPDYHAVIKLELPPKEIITLYRALPWNPKLVLIY